jgi:hypothetical protein
LLGGALLTRVAWIEGRFSDETYCSRRLARKWFWQKFLIPEMSKSVQKSSVPSLRPIQEFPFSIWPLLVTWRFLSSQWPLYTDEGATTAVH